MDTLGLMEFDDILDEIGPSIGELSKPTLWWIHFPINSVRL
jgi:hypothetical protein